MFKLFGLLNKKYKSLSFVAALLTFLQVITDLIVPSLLATLITVVVANGISQDSPQYQSLLKVVIIYKDWYIKTSSLQESLAVSLGMMTGFSILGIGFGLSSSYLASKVSVELAKVTRQHLFEKIQKLSLSNISKFSTSSLVTRLTNDVTQVQNIMLIMLRIMIRAPFLFIGGLIFCLLTNLNLSITLGIMIPLMLIIIAVFSWLTVPLFIKNQKLLDAINKESRENILGVRVIKSFNLEEKQDSKFNLINNEWCLNSTKAFVRMNIMIPLIMFVTNISLIIMSILARSFYNISQTDIIELSSQITVFSQYLGYVTGGLMMSVMVVVIYIRSKISAKRINEILVEVPDIQKISEGLLIEGSSVEFNNVSFKYGKDSEDVLSNISFKLKEGETLGIIGPTGSGKSTLVSLLSRTFVPYKGEVLVDNKNVNEINTIDLNNKVAQVLQENILFSGTIKSNLLFGKEDATDEDIDKAIDIACAKPFIYKFEDNLNHKVEQRAKNLSGGQKQRLSIARALIREPKILILDDSTSALDAITDVTLRNNIKTKMKGTTTIIAAQKVNSIKDADNIMVLDAGKIVGYGKHNDLVKKCSLYKEIVASQMNKEEQKNV